MPDMADAVFALILFYSLIFGARRGFYKEVIQFVALIVAISVARKLAGPAGAAISDATSLPVTAAEVIAVIGVWIVAFFAVALIGRLILKKLRGKGVDDSLGESAEAVADALAGDTTKGPLTLLTDPIASKRGMFYWSDKLLGAGLGLCKGVITCIVIGALVVYANRARDWDWSFAKSVEDSYGRDLFQGTIEPYLVTFPEYRIATSWGEMKRIAQLVKQDPRRFITFAEHPELKGLRNDPRIAELAQDPEVHKAWMSRDLVGLLKNEKVRATAGDAEFRARLAAINWERVRKDVEASQALGAQPPAPPEPPRPPLEPSPSPRASPQINGLIPDAPASPSPAASEPPVEVPEAPPLPPAETPDAPPIPDGQ